MKYNRENIELKEYMPGFRGRAIHGEKLTQVYWQIDAGSELGMHHHDEEQTVNLLSGSFLLHVGEDSYTLKPGDVVVIPSCTPHGGTALEDCRILDVFVPVREMFK